MIINSYYISIYKKKFFIFNLMKITFKLGTTNTKQVEVQPYEELNVLMNRLNLTDKKSKFMYRGQTYGICSTLTFQDIGMVDGARIFVNNQAISGTIENIHLKDK